MANIESYLDRVCRGLGGSASLRRHLRHELREHILEAADRHKAAGLSPEEALDKAIADFGDPSAVHQDLEDVYGRNLLGVLIEKAMQWKEKTMKAKWLWSATASLILLLAIFAQGFFAFCGLWLVVPRLKEMFKEVGEELPGYAIKFLNFTSLIIFQNGWIVLLVPLIAWAVFEWRYRGENKPLIRLSVLAFVSLATTALMWWAAVSTVFPLVHVYGSLYAQQPERVALESLQSADAAMAQLDRAARDGDTSTAWLAAGLYRAALEHSYIRDSTVTGLAVVGQPERLSEIRDQLRQLTMLAQLVGKANAEQLPERNQQMQQAYAKLKSLIGNKPAGAATQPASQSAATIPSAGT